MNADLRVVSDEQFPFALNYFTGSKEHNIALRQRAIDYGFKLNEYELAGAREERPVQGGSRHLQGPGSGLHPAGDAREHRRDRRRRRASAAAPARGRATCTGIFHCHTTWSDGAASLEQMAEAARKLGFKYLGIADHSQSLTVANGLTPERVRQQQKEIDALNARLKGIHIFKGTECDILRRRLARFRRRGARRLSITSSPASTRHFNQTAGGDDRPHHQGDRASARDDAGPCDGPVAAAPRRLQGRSRTRSCKRRPSAAP